MMAKMETVARSVEPIYFVWMSFGCICELRDRNLHTQGSQCGKVLVITPGQ